MSPEIMNELLQLKDESRKINLQFHQLAVFIMVENLSLSFFLDLKKQLRKGSPVIAPVDYVKLTYPKLFSHRINFKNRKRCFPTA